MTPPNKSQFPTLRGARVREVIEVAFNHGEGIAIDPVRRVHAYYDKDGDLLAWDDPTGDIGRKLEPGFLTDGLHE